MAPLLQRSKHGIDTSALTVPAQKVTLVGPQIRASLRLVPDQPHVQSVYTGDRLVIIQTPSVRRHREFGRLQWCSRAAPGSGHSFAALTF